MAQIDWTCLPSDGLPRRSCTVRAGSPATTLSCRLMREPKPRGAGGQLAPNRITSGEEQQRKLLYHTDLWCLCSRPSEPHGRARGSEFAFWSIPTISSDPLPCGQCFKTHLADASSRRPLQLLQQPPTGHPAAAQDQHDEHLQRLSYSAQRRMLGSSRVGRSTSPGWARDFARELPGGAARTRFPSGFKYC